jgi:hypothetical protein
MDAQRREQPDQRGHRGPRTTRAQMVAVQIEEG